jgi:hypothetical protein
VSAVHVCRYAQEPSLAASIPDSLSVARLIRFCVGSFATWLIVDSQPTCADLRGRARLRMLYRGNPKRRHRAVSASEEIAGAQRVATSVRAVRPGLEGVPMTMRKSRAASSEPVGRIRSSPASGTYSAMGASMM